MLTTLLLTLLSAPIADIEIERAFTNHSAWRRPVWFGPMDSKSDWHALVEQKGVIHTFKVNKKGEASKPQVFLDISDDVSRQGNEEGMIGLAFHPEFDKNRRINQQRALIFDNDSCKYDVIFGTNFLSKTGIKLDYDKGNMHWFDNVLPMRPTHINSSDFAAMEDSYLVQLEDEILGDDWLDCYAT